MKKEKRKKIDKLALWKKFILFFWAFIFLGIFSLLFLFYLATKGFLGKLPNPKHIENPSLEEGSDVYDINGKLLGRFFSENRSLISYNQLPDHLINALLAKEDIRFREHSGLDRKSILRAISFLGVRGGGSTISQQLAKLLFTKNTSKSKLNRLRQKILEWITAIELEKRYSKEEIIALYLNTFDFLYNAKGIQTASLTYFNKIPSELSLNESATLVAMLSNPALYNPKLHPKNAKIQRNVVLYQMRKYNFIEDEVYIKEKEVDIELSFKLQKQNFGLLTYYSEFLKKEIAKALDEYEDKTGERLDLNTSGLKIYTSIDSKMQEYGERNLANHLKELQYAFNKSQEGNKNAPFLGVSAKKREEILSRSMQRTLLYQKLKNMGLSEQEITKEFKKPKKMTLFSWEGPKEHWISPWEALAYNKSIMQGGLLSIEASTGFIKAWVGGINYDHFQYDHVAQTKRQVGSVFKPIVYAAAMETLNYGPCTKVSNEPFVEGNWSPRNSDEKYGGEISIKDALAKSVNTISARVISKLGVNPVIKLAKKMGINSFIPSHLSIALGSSDITLYEMTSAFNTFANYGNYIKPTFLVKIKDRRGKIIKKYRVNNQKALDEKIAYSMLSLLKNVVDNGTARGVRRYGITAEVAGKTGTTNDHADGWFIGMTPLLTTGIWIGWENRYSHFSSLAMGQGARMALPIWAYYMKNVFEDKDLVYSKDEKFDIPDDLNRKWENCEDIHFNKFFEKNSNEMNFENEVRNQEEINYDD